MEKIFFLDCYSILSRKIGQNNTFDFEAAKEVFWENSFCPDIPLPYQVFLS
jgi:hypothetical protein